ncbi:phage holin, LLH family [Paenibacillus sp. A3M_27_13]|uniref:phage holin, LLH family n=1 Tax=Paenibacillus sp. A3M_27_13 TaxID=2962029 RepID=UPI0020B6D415
MIHKIAGEGFALAQTAFKEAGGERKLQEALQYASLTLSSQGIVVSQVELRSAIEKAYLEYKAKTKTMLATEAEPNEDAAQAAVKDALSSLAAKVTAILTQATGPDATESTVPETHQDTAPAPQANVTGVAVE